MGEPCSTYAGYITSCKILVGKPARNLGDLSVDSMIELKWILNK
jgi:hypothetical protein